MFCWIHLSRYPRCYYKPDGFDAMEGSISGDGCRPSNNAMWYGNALVRSAPVSPPPHNLFQAIPARSLLEISNL